MPKAIDQQNAVRSAFSSLMPAARTRKSRTPPPSAREVFRFWFVDHSNKDWFGFNPEFDAELRRKYAGTLDRALRGELVDWRKTPEGRLAEIVVLDQFARQIHRGEGGAFAGDAIALILSQEAVAAGIDKAIRKEWRFFFYMPFMHSESLAIHEKYMKLFRAQGDDRFLDFEIAHRDVIARFGRYPVRNGPLGRKSTKAELAYIKKRGGAIF